VPRRITTLRPILLVLGLTAAATAGVGATITGARERGPRGGADSKPGASVRTICSPALPCIALVIDDVGRDLAALRALLTLDPELTFSVLPHAAQREESLQALRAAGRELMLHLPMVPHDRSRVSDEAIVLGIARPLAPAARACVDRVPDAVALNNHMGSALSEDERAMDEVLLVARERGLDVLDSRTSERSRVCEVARRLGLRCLARDLFLDDAPGGADTQEVARRLRLAWSRARQRGWAIAIGHPYAATIDALRATRRESAGVRLVRLSRLFSSIVARRSPRAGSVDAT
jgi:polysaccharide deacetylase 2 family uncharacterized protein YibQ